VTLSRRQLLGAGLALAATSSRALADEPGSAAPVLFVSHGTPLMLPGNEARVASLRAWGAGLPRPRGIVVMTPHFAARRLELGPSGPGFAMYNLPPRFKRLLPPDLDYKTPPSVALATRLESLLGQSLPRAERRGFDHTTWMPLLSLFPAADLPVIELGYPYVPEREAFALGQKLAALRDEGILFLASGGMTHNLGVIGGPTPSWAAEFDHWASEAISGKAVDDMIGWRGKAPAADLAHPDDGAHFRVVLTALGIALDAKAPAANVKFPLSGFEGAVSSRSVELS
jgi:4,5-DOPA dioxygenase extradiol